MSEKESNNNKSKVKKDTKMDDLVSLCKRRGFIFQSSEIYGGMANAWDYGPLGVELKNNIKKLWWQMFVQQRGDMVGLDAALIMSPRVWEASGHVAGFSDPLVECLKTKKRYRADHLLEENGLSAEGLTLDEINKIIKEKNILSSEGGQLSDVRQFNLMFKTHVGPTTDSGSEAYLRPETAQAIFANFKNILESSRMRVPFGVAQIGKAFRNEITTGNFLFRTREFEQMEIEYFITESEWESQFEYWLGEVKKWLAALGLSEDNVVFHNIPKEELAHYSKRTIDIEYKYPFGQKELYGLAYRQNYDLQKHIEFSGQDLSYRDPVTGEKFVPHVIEPSMGVDRTVLAVLLEAYEEVAGGRTQTTESIKEKEVILRLPKVLAPVKVAVLPLSKKEPLSTKAQEIAVNLRKFWTVQYDETGSIGKRYRRQDEIGTPYCVTVDFETLEDEAVTVRDRDTMAQQRIKIVELENFVREDMIK